MNDKKTLLVVGGDLRQIYCGRYLFEKYDISYMGFDSKYLPENSKTVDLNQSYDYIILPVVAIIDDIYVNTPFYSEKLKLSELKTLIHKNTVVFTGKVNDDIKSYFPENEVLNYLNREELSVLNAIPTAEGAIQIALEELPVTLNGLKVLITGFGRIGKALINILRGFGAEVYVLARSAESKAWASVYGIKLCDKNDVDDKFMLIINTAPTLILDKDMLEKLNKDSLVIDLASKPGGVDFKTASEIGLKVVWALGLPGKYAPITAGEIIANTIEGMISERGLDYGILKRN